MMECKGEGEGEGEGRAEQITRSQQQFDREITSSVTRYSRVTYSCVSMILSA